MSTTEHVCRGLDGSNPLHMLAACGVLSAIEDANIPVRMQWRKSAGWHPVYEVALDRAALCQKLALTFLSTESITHRQQIDAAESACAVAHTVLKSAENTRERLECTEAVTKAEIKAAKATVAAAKESYKNTKHAVDDAQKRIMTIMSDVRRLHPVTTSAQHLDNIDKGGLSAVGLRELLPGHSYLAGLAACLDMTAKVQGGMKTTIARSVFSFANNNSGKALLKDFANLAACATPERIDDALFGPGTRMDAITGLGWDPASQRSYALQFADPQDLVECQAMHHALAFYGLSCFPVVPTARDRATTGFMVTQRGASAHAESEDDDEESDRAKGKRQDWFQWPLWSAWLSPRTARSVLAMEVCSASQPDHDALDRMGIPVIFRARRFSLNKRSYFAPGVPA